MIKTKTVSKSEEVFDYIECDICHKKYTDHGWDLFEKQEFLNIDTVGGYDSVFGDGAKIKYNICQHCLYDWLKSKNALTPEHNQNGCKKSRE